MESPHDWIMRIEILSAPWALVGFNDFIIELVSLSLKDIVFNCLSVFINNGGSLLVFSKGLHWEAKKLLNKFTFSTMFVTVLPDARIGGMEGVLILWIIQDGPIDFGISVFIIKRITFLLNIAHFCIYYEIWTFTGNFVKFSKSGWVLNFHVKLFCYVWPFFQVWLNQFC